MAERRENSVQFSLRELRQIEDERVKQEVDAEKARLDAERMAKEDAVRLAREESERKTRDEQERQRKLQEDKERQLREEQNRLEAEKHRAQVEAQTRLEETRVRAEVQAAAAQKKPNLGLVFGLVGAILVLAGGTLGYVLLVYNPAQQAIADKKRADELAVIKRQFDEQRAQFDKQQQDLKDQLNRTTDAAEKARLEAALAASQAAKQEVQNREKAAMDAARPSRPRVKGGGGGSKTPGAPGSNQPKCDPNDPLCGSGL